MEANVARSGPTVSPQGAPLTWSLCVATLNRIDALEECVRCALAQSRPPSEIVVVDASDDWEAHRAKIADLARNANVPLTYLRAEKRSLAHQRNQGARAATSDILFMIDDDANLHPDCAERIMAAYEGDTGGLVGAIACTEASEVGATPSSKIEQKDNSAARSSWVRSALSRSSFVRFVWREVLLMSADRLFIQYDGARPAYRPELVERLGRPSCVAVKYIPGFALTVRRDLVLREPFEGALLSYCPTEDTEATYRFTRHAANAQVVDARIYHHHAASGRIKRRQAIELTMTNLAFFVRKRSSDQRRDVARYYILAFRRAFAELLKDGLSRRWSFPQLRGTLAGTRRSVAVFRADRASIDDWYQTVQQEILHKNTRPPKG